MCKMKGLISIWLALLSVLGGAKEESDLAASLSTDETCDSNEQGGSLSLIPTECGNITGKIVQLQINI